MTNMFIVDGTIGKIERRESTVFMRLCHKDSFFNKKTNEWERREDWFSIAFFGKTGDALEREGEIGDRAIVQGSLAEYPKNSPGAQIRMNAKSFDILLPYVKKGVIDVPSPEDADQVG